jgi:hypothetical protein
MVIYLSEFMCLCFEQNKCDLLKNLQVHQVKAIYFKKIIYVSLSLSLSLYIYIYFSHFNLVTELLHLLPWADNIQGYCNLARGKGMAYPTVGSEAITRLFTWATFAAELKVSVCNPACFWCVGDNFHEHTGKKQAKSYGTNHSWEWGKNECKCPRHYLPKVQFLPLSQAITCQT